MRLSSLFGPATAGVAYISYLFILSGVNLLPFSSASPFTPTPPLHLDLGPLGRIALAGNFDSISLFQYEEQRQTPSVNDIAKSQSLLAPLPNGVLATLSSADDGILALCSLTGDDGKLENVVVAGNFTSLGKVQSTGVALFNSTSGDVTPIPGLSGRVTSLLCDDETGTVYLGGDFKRSNSTNAVSWSKDSGFSSLPFEGFNGPVTDIVKVDDGHIVFGGTFDGLGNITSPKHHDQQIVNLETARVTVGASTGTAGFNEPRNVVCGGSGEDAPGKTWLLPDNAPGFWRADMNFGFEPTKLRIWNTHKDGRGTKKFRFTALPDNGILNMTYVDPESGRKVACDAFCPLSADTSEEFRDFTFVNNVGMNGFQLDITDWYGQGGGFNGIQLFQDRMYLHLGADI